MSVPPRKKRRQRGTDAQGAVQPTDVRRVLRANTTRPRANISRLYDSGETGRALNGRYTGNPRVQIIIERRHQRLLLGIHNDGYYYAHAHRWRVPGGVRDCIARPLLWGQIVNKYPWAVVWRSPKDGKKKRKLFQTAGGAIHFIATKAQYVDNRACIVSRQVGYDIPLHYVNKVPRPWRWCPYCMTLRKFKRSSDHQTFYALRKEWSSSKQRYEWKERKLALLVCPTCGCTNKDVHMRRSNQPYEVKQIKQKRR